MKKGTAWLLAGIALLCIAGLVVALILSVTACGVGSLILLSSADTFEVSPVPTVTAQPQVSVSPAPEAYPPENAYDDRAVVLDVTRIDADTISITNKGGADSSSLKKLWVNVNMAGYIEPSSGEVTSQYGSSAYYAVPEDSLVTLTGEFDDCNSILWGGTPSVPAPVPTVAPTPVPTPVVTSTASSAGDYYSRTYHWSFEDYDYSWELAISKASYEYYKSQPHNRESDFAMYAMSDYDRPYLQSLAAKLKEAAARDGFSEQDAVLLTIAFVQSLPYTSDSVTTGHDEYPRYPLETLVDDGGDCEDTAILTAALLHEMGYGVVLLEFPDHVAVGVKGSEDYPGTYWEYGSTRYYYLETTGEDWEIGQVPEKYQDQKAIVRPMHQVPKIDLRFDTSYESSDSSYIYYRVHCDYENIGTGTAKNVSIYFAALALSEGDDRVWLPDQTVVIGDCVEGGSGWAEATLKIPRNEEAQIECIAFGDNVQTTVKKTNRFNT